MQPNTMSKEEQAHQTYLNIAREMATLSSAERAKVGAILVKDNNIIAEGYNGTPHGFDNVCEYYDPYINFSYTKPEVLHAETNAITKIARSTRSSDGSTLYVTTAPCFECSKLIIQAGITQVIYQDDYIDDGLRLLNKAGIKTRKLAHEKTV